MGQASYLLTVICIGFAAGGAALLVRALPWPRRWKRRKPLSCIACMAGHSAWIAYLYAIWLDVLRWEGLLWFGGIWLAIAGVSACVLGMSGSFSGLDGLDEPVEPDRVARGST